MFQLQLYQGNFILRRNGRGRVQTAQKGSEIVEEGLQ